ncbi:hypothetical protein [Burkholderia sp. Ac-20392]|uniref:hypothetical protein n=1 Tax=Burkholderia sp. Ac-20392 TaxID=2703905 RepID=UPI001981DF40|nr:hypothetical protein [Burkholderia sp. Ac-20392]MBN3793593.1 hypothetical protein [Burkholderia sp. Ac-20392]
MNTFETLSFYRGVSVKYRTDQLSLIVPRRDRRPKDSSQHFHDIADEWFKIRFGIPYRSHGVFLTSRFVTASAHAATVDHVMRVIPVGAYKYCWSPEVKDLLFAAKRFASSPRDEIGEYLESVRYQEVDLQDAQHSGHELMLFCERYVAIPTGILGVEPDIENTSIILTP